MIKKIWAEDIGKLREAALAATPDHLEWLSEALDLLSDVANQKHLANLHRKQGDTDRHMRALASSDYSSRKLQEVLGKA